MTQILASIEDINGQLNEDVAEINDGDDDQLQIDAQRVIRGQLVGTFTPVTLAGWDEPDNTPQLIRGIAARLIAAKWFSIRFSGASADIPPYAQNLYNEAIAMLEQIRNGSLTVTDDEGNPIGGSDSSLDSTQDMLLTEPIFTMSREFA